MQIQVKHFKHHIKHQNEKNVTLAMAWLLVPDRLLEEGWLELPRTQITEQHSLYLYDIIHFAAATWWWLFKYCAEDDLIFWPHFCIIIFKRDKNISGEVNGWVNLSIKQTYLLHTVGLYIKYNKLNKPWMLYLFCTVCSMRYTMWYLLCTVLYSKWKTIGYAIYNNNSYSISLSSILIISQ